MYRSMEKKLNATEIDALAYDAAVSNIPGTVMAAAERETMRELFAKGYTLGFTAERDSSFGTTDPDADELWEAAAAATGTVGQDTSLSDEETSRREEMFMGGFVEGVLAAAEQART